ncbi:MAG: transglycosylase domain-containing protein, partial [Gammaproteobacteria bacterium]
VIASIVDVDRGEAVPFVRVDPIEIGVVHGDEFEDRVLVDIDDVPARFLKILVAVEDRRFYDHFGLDGIGIARAAVTNIIAGRVAEGGSTITQQLVKNLYLSNTRSWTRKLREALFAISLERRYTKSEILEGYVNEIFLGQSGNRAIHGFGLASRFYFAKPLSELNLAQMAMLVGMVKAPSSYNPKRHPEAAAQRLNTVLDLLVSREIISPADYSQAVAADLRLAPDSTIGAGEFAAVNDLIRDQLRRDYRDEDLQLEGLRIFTTIDTHIQRIATRTAASALEGIERAKKIKRGTLELAVVVLNPRTAEIVGLVGGRDGRAAEFNRALNARRPFGSLVKPFVYSVALDQTTEFNVATVLNDEVMTVPLPNGESWTPKNYDGKTHGSVSLSEAFTRSYNLATVHLGLKLGVGGLADRLFSMGLDEKPSVLPSLLLGALDVTPLDVAQLYQAIANDGFKVPLRAIRSVSNARNKTLSRYPPRVEQVLSVETAFLIQYLLGETVRDGTARTAGAALASRLPLAGKTGTSNDGRDSWFAGFGGDFLVVVWVGRDDNGATGLTGASGALKIWTALMQAFQSSPFVTSAPAGLEWQFVSAGGSAIVPQECTGAIRIPLALPHGLETLTRCVDEAPSESSLWQRVRKVLQ